jgi:hypothetical protein
VLLLIAAASQLPVPGVDRWLVFARAKNTVNLYYGRI